MLSAISTFALVIPNTKTRAIVKARSASHVLTAVFLAGLALFLAWRELRAELDASVKDFASSLEHRHELPAD